MNDYLGYNETQVYVCCKDMLIEEKTTDFVSSQDRDMNFIQSKRTMEKCATITPNCLIRHSNSSTAGAVRVVQLYHQSVGRRST